MSEQIIVKGDNRTLKALEKFAGSTVKAGLTGGIATTGLAFSFNQITQAFNKLLSIVGDMSPALQGSFKVLSTALGLFFKPFADFLGMLLMPVAIKLLKFIMWLQGSEWGKLVLTISGGLAAVVTAVGALNLAQGISNVLTGPLTATGAVTATGGIASTGRILAEGAVISGAVTIGEIVLGSAAVAYLSAAMYNAFKEFGVKPYQQGMEDAKKEFYHQTNGGAFITPQGGVAGESTGVPNQALLDYTQKTGLKLDNSGSFNPAVPEIFNWATNIASETGQSFDEAMNELQKGTEQGKSYLDVFNEQLGVTSTKINESNQSFIDLGTYGTTSLAKIKIGADVNIPPTINKINGIKSSAEEAKKSLDALAERINTMPVYGGGSSSLFGTNISSFGTY